jgi:DNA-binding MarR family transcriptional regulator
MAGDTKLRAEAAERLHSIAVRLLRRARAADRDSELGPAQLSALSVLYFAGEMPVTALADAEQVRQPTMTRIVAGLVAAGAATRATAAGDRRVQLVTITDAGRKMFEAAREHRLVIARRLLARLPAERVEALLPLLHEVADAINSPD